MGSENDSRGSVDEATKDAERDESVSGHQADRAPTTAEEAAADSAKPDAGERDEVARHEQEMNELGANAKGEGRID